MTFRLSNEQFRFIAGVRISIPRHLVREVSVFVSRQLAPGSWGVVPYKLIYDEIGALVWFHHPDNWANLELNVVAAYDGTVRCGLVFVEELSDSTALELVARKKIIFLGLARDCVNRIPGSIAKLNELGGLFRDSDLIVFENDSRDGTGEVLSAMSLTQNMRLIRESGLDEIFPRRTERLAYARNLLVDLIEEDDSYDYVCWVDLDGLVDERFSNQGFISNFKIETVWDGVFPTTEPHYYDIWALREKTICPDDYILAETVKLNGVLNQSFVPHIAVGKLTSRNLLGWFRVDSAFGGMGIYKRKFANMARYCGFMNGHEICEHVPYHFGLIEAGARLYINPSFVTNL